MKSSQSDQSSQEVQYLNALFSQFTTTIRWQLINENEIQSVSFPRENLETVRDALFKLGFTKVQINENKDQITLSIERPEALKILNKAKESSLYSFIELYAKHAIPLLKEVKEFNTKYFANRFALFMFHANSIGHADIDSVGELFRHKAGENQGLPLFVSFPLFESQAEYRRDAADHHYEPGRTRYRVGNFTRKTELFSPNPTIWKVPDIKTLASYNPIVKNAIIHEALPSLFPPLRKIVTEYARDDTAEIEKFIKEHATVRHDGTIMVSAKDAFDLLLSLAKNYDDTLGVKKRM